ncbi:MAG: hypothetical protein HQ579_09105 [Candidatus Omnitrophica bacterium]|nr:hypothetical protein [Candidatus Omnitrophota bacterium]
MNQETIKRDFKLFGHGENSVTFQLFSSMNKRQLRRFLSNADWASFNPNIKEAAIQEVHLFPCFGKAKGYGEPDIIILSSGRVIYVEVELAFLDKGKLPKQFVKQMKKFTLLANDICGSSKKRITKKFSEHYEFRGQQKLRSLYAKIKKEKRKPYFLVISNSIMKNVNASYLQKKLTHAGLIAKNFSLGWINFNKINKMKGLSKVIKTINFNLRD